MTCLQTLFSEQYLCTSKLFGVQNHLSHRIISLILSVPLNSFYCFVVFFYMEVMHYVHGLADGNATEAKHICQERYPNSALPDSGTFSNIHGRLSETGSSHKGNS